MTFGVLALAAVPAVVLQLQGELSAAKAVQAAKPNSTFAGVQIGWNSTGDYKTAIDQCLETGISGLENRSSTVPFIQANASRITHVHVKDRKFGPNGGANIPVGEGRRQLTHAPVSHSRQSLVESSSFPPARPTEARVAGLRASVRSLKRATGRLISLHRKHQQIDSGRTT